MRCRPGWSVVLGFLLAFPSTALAFGEHVSEPNWKLWLVGTLVGVLILAPLVATVCCLWWIRRMRAGIARIYSYLMGIVVAAVASLGAHVWFVGPVADLALYLAAAALFVLLLVATLTTRRRFA